MSTGHDDKADALVAFASGALIGVALTLLFVRMQKNRASRPSIDREDYHYDGGDLFI